MNKHKISLLIKYLFFLIWTAFISYKWISIAHNAEGIQSGAAGLANTLRFWDIGAHFSENIALNTLFLLKFAFFAAALYGLGRFLLLKMFKFNGSRLELYIFSCALGHAAAGTVFFIIAALKLLYLPAIIAILSVFICLGLISAKYYKISLPGRKKIIQQFSSLGFFYKILALLSALSTLLSFSAIFTPDTGFDALNYYIAMPNWWIINHGIADMPTHTYFNLFGFYACIYAPAMAFGGDLMAKAVNFYAILPGTLGLGFYFGKKYFSMKTAIMALAVICMTYQFNGMAFTTRSDSMMILFSLAALAAALKIPRGIKSSENAKSQRIRLTLLAAILSGAAMAVKATSILLVMPIMAIMFYRAANYNGKIQKDLAKKSFLQLLSFTAAASLLVIPWLIKNYIYRGNPFFPFLTGIFGLPGNYDAGLLFFFYAFSNFYYGVKFMCFKNLNAIFFLNDYVNNHYMSPMVLMMFGFLIFNKYSLNKKHIFLAFFAVSALIMQLNSFSIARFYFPVYIVFVLFAAHYAKKFIENNNLLKVCFLLIAFIIWLPAFSAADFSIIKGQKTYEQYLADSNYGKFYLYASVINEKLPGKIYLINEDYLGRSAYLKKRHYTTSAFDKNFFEATFSAEDSPEEMLETLYKQGFTHILMNGFKHPLLPGALDYRLDTANSGLYNHIREFTAKYLKALYRFDPDKYGRTTYIFEINYDSLKPV